MLAVDQLHTGYKDNSQLIAVNSELAYSNMYVQKCLV